MHPTFRQSMTWLHSWSGLLIGSLLFVVFWMGTLSVFDREIDRWMMPDTRLDPAVLHDPLVLDGPVGTQIERLTRGASQWSVVLPYERAPVLRLSWRPPGSALPERRYLHPRTGAVLNEAETLGGSGFIYPFHYSLHLKWKDLGYWLAGLAGLAMLVGVVSGVVIHRKLLADFFLFRPRKQLPRASLDLHNLTGVLLLPFHFAIALSGLIVFMGIYWPAAPWAAYPGAGPVAAQRAFQAEGMGVYRRAPAGRPAVQAPKLDALLAQARQHWPGSEAYFLRVWHPGDANSYVELRRSPQDQVPLGLEQLYFDAASGALLHEFNEAPVMRVQRFISGLHYVQFKHWTLRWLYFAAGLGGCVMIGTGFVFWLESRRVRHARQGLRGVRVVEALSIATLPGVIGATLAFLIANRLLPAQAGFGGLGRADLEMAAFYLCWLLSLAHAGWRGRPAWATQVGAVAIAAAAAVLLNTLTTGMPLWRSLQQGQWGVAGVDTALLCLAALSAWAASRLRRHAHRSEASNLASRVPAPGERHA